MQDALVIATPTLLTACALRGWLGAGHRVAELWCCEPQSGFLRPPRSLAGRLFPDFDAVRIVRQAGIKVRPCPPLRHWAEAAGAARATGADVLVTLMTMQIVPDALLDVFGPRAVNLHPALLPHYRGPAPRVGMLFDGEADRHGGVTLHVLAPAIDEGAIIAHSACPRSAAGNLFQWDHQIAAAAGRLMARDLPRYLRGEIAARPQAAGQGSYRRLGRGEADLGPHLDLTETRRRFAAFGPHHLHRWVGADGQTVQVTGLVAVQGGRSGTPDRLTAASFQTDLRDARVVFRRRSPLFQIRRTAARLAAMRDARQRLHEKEH
ncbi:methionyl-tRNA formyltransferase [Cereibacter ovatus]|uniref:Methionyl-tRNA formyltransferase n=1 Tax=Cereibacter ovatus TaxID=439529 RepID=A0A285CU01_9RHOB|nr:formyltransferase family protein [Cereibacter ovatus]SNX70994.1 methionyl-tRNA formyltransferase [Cereibacter ovatus]